MEKKRLDLKDKVNFEIYDVTVRLTNNGNTHIAQYLTNQRQVDNELTSQSIEHPKKNIFI